MRSNFVSVRPWSNATLRLVNHLIMIIKLGNLLSDTVCGQSFKTVSYEENLQIKLKIHVWQKSSFVLRIETDIAFQNILEILYDYVANSTEPNQTAQIRWLILIYTARDCLMVDFRRVLFIYLYILR